MVKKVILGILLLASFVLQANQSMEDLAMHAYRSGDYRTAYHQLFLAKQAYLQNNYTEGAARCWLYMCSSLLFQGQYERCEQELDVVKSYLSKNTPNHSLLRAKYYQVKGALLSDQSHFDDAVPLLQSAISIFKRSGSKSRKDAVNTINLLGNIYLETSRYDKAISTYRTALQLLRETPETEMDSNALANTLGNMGATFQYLEQWDSATYYHSFSKKIYTQLYSSTHPKVANQVYNLALISLETGYFDEAINGFQQALKVYEGQEYPFHPELSEIYGSLGAVYARKGEWNAAISSFYQDSLHTFLTFGPDHPFMALCYQEVAATRLLMGNPSEAKRLLNKATGIFLRNYTSHTDLVRNYLLLGKAMFQEGDYVNGIKSLDKAYQMERTLRQEESSRTAEILLYTGYCYLHLGNQQNAKVFFDKSLLILSEKKIHVGSLLSEGHLAMSNYFALEKKSSLELLELQKALQATHNRHSVLFPMQFIQSCKSLAEYYVKTGYPDKSLEYIDRAYKICNGLRSTYAYETSAYDLAEKVRKLSDLGMDICFRLHIKKGSDFNYLDKALAYSEYNKAFQLRQHTSALQNQKLTGISKKAKETESRLKAEIAYYHSLMEAYTTGKQIPGKNITAIQDKIFNLSNEYNRFMERVREYHPEYFALAYASDVPKIAVIKRSLPSKQSLLIFHAAPAYLFIIGISKSGDPIFHKVLARDVGDLCAQLMSAIQNNNYTQYTNAAYQLFDQLFRKLPASYQENHLIVIADGPLQVIPFEALLSREPATRSPKELPFLIRRQSVMYSPSVNLYLAKRSYRRNKKATVTAFVPFFDKANAAMFGEIDAIKDNFVTRVMVGKAASKKSLAEWMPHSDILHFATHGTLNNEYPLQSYLALSGKEEEGKLYAYEMYNMQTRARLVTLGACHSGEGPVASGEGKINLARAFMYSGATNVVMTLWAVPDNSTSKILSYFYSNISRGSPKEDALRKAKLSYLETCDPAGAMPLYWAGTVMTGDMHALKLNEPWISRNWLLISLLLLLAGGITGRFVYGRYVV